MLVYLAGPIKQGHRIDNIKRAIDAADRIAVRGHAVFIPHLNDFWGLLHPHEYEFWMKQDFAILKKCEVVVRLHGPSEGADREVGLAKQMGIPTFGAVDRDGLSEFINSPYWCKTEPFS